MAYVLSVPIPASAPLASLDEKARALPIAPAIAVGNVVSLDDLDAAQQETVARKVARFTHDGIVTKEEVAHSVLREAAVTAECVAGRYGPAGAPAWGLALINSMNARFDDLKAEVNNRIDGLETAVNTRIDGLATAVNANTTRMHGLEVAVNANTTRMDGLEAAVNANTTRMDDLGAVVNVVNARIDGLETMVNVVGARQQCADARQYNCSFCNTGTPAHPFKQLVKVIAGTGPPLAIPGKASVAEPVPEHPVGTPYPVEETFVPANLTALNAMTHAQISALSQWANDDFEIEAEDAIHTRRIKLNHHYYHR